MSTILFLFLIIFAILVIWHLIIVLIPDKLRWKCDEKYFLCRLRRKLIPDLVIGMVVFFTLWPVHESIFLSNPEDSGLDFMMSAHQCRLSGCEFNSNVPNFAFLDIDDRTYQQSLKEPLVIPRCYVKELIETAVKGKARLVVVDLDLSQKIPNELSELSSDDKVLYDYLAKYKGTNCHKDESCPPIILVRALHTVIEPSQVKENHELVYEPRKGFLEDAVIQSYPHIQWGSVQFGKSFYDNVLREWELAQPTCEDNQLQVIPSIYLLAASITFDNEASLTKKHLENTLSSVKTELEKWFKPVKCPAKTYELPPIPGSLIFAKNSRGESLEMKSGEMKGVRQRIIFKMPWLPPTAEDWTTTRYTLGTHLSVFSAESYREKMRTSDLLKDKIVVIGGSYGEGRDTHKTPLKEMPGGLVLINAISSLFEKEIVPLEMKWMLLIEMVLISAMTFLFALINRHSIWIMTAIVIFVFLPVPVASFYFLKLGIWMSFPIPLLAVLIHHIAADYYEMAKEVNQLHGKTNHTNIEENKKHLKDLVKQNQHLPMVENVASRPVKATATEKENGAINLGQTTNSPSMNQPETAEKTADSNIKVPHKTPLKT